MAIKYLEQQYYDLNIIPDKKNTGCDTSLITTTVSSAGTYNGIVYGTTGTRRSFEFQYSANKNLGATVTIENTMFPDGLQDINVHLIARIITFNNCYFVGRYAVPAGNNATYIYNNCSFEYCSPSYSNFYNCKFLRTTGAGDGMNPYRDVYVYDSYIYDLVHLTTATNVHCDGVQIFGHSTTDATNIHYIRCRKITPMFPISGQATGTYANAPIMIQLESSNGIDISFEDCIINGGGYSIYAWAKTAGLTLTDVLLKNISVGGAKRYGTTYPTVSDGVTFENIYNTSKLYISSTPKTGADTIITVSNDTLIEKTLIICSNLGTQTFIIAPCLSSAVIMQEPITQYYSFDDYPFDLEHNIGAVDWFVAYDTSIADENQIRFVNYTENPIPSPVPSLTLTNSIELLAVRRMNLLYKIANSTPVYTQLAYLQSDGTQIIDTDIIGNNDLIIETDIETVGNLFTVLFGAQGTAGSATAGRFSMTKTASTYNTSSVTMSTAIVSGTRYTMLKDGNVTYLNGTQVASSTVGTFTSINPIGIFGGFIGTTYKVSTSLHSYKLHNKFKITKKSTGEVLRDFITVLDSSSVPCLYDKISKTFFYKESGNAFTYA